MATSKFSNKEKAEAAKREAGYRRHVYPRRVSENKMRPELARRQIELMEEIQADYERLAEQDQPRLL